MAEKEKFVVQLAWLSGTRHLLKSQTNWVKSGNIVVQGKNWLLQGVWTPCKFQGFYAYTYMYVHTHRHMHTYIHMHIHIHIGTYERMHTQTQTCTQVNECKYSYSTTKKWLSIFKIKRMLSVYTYNYYSKSTVPDSNRWYSFFYPFDLPPFILMVCVDTHELI